MPSVKHWASSLANINSREFSCRRRASIADSYVRRISETSISNMDVNDSERTLVGSLEVEDMHSYGVDQEQRRRQLSAAPATSRKQGREMEKDKTKYRRSIERRVDYCVVEDDRYALQLGNYTGVWAGNTCGSVPQTRSRYFGDHIHQSAYNSKA
ncbi:hypothetical protein C2857_001371 [Epichloe festucae Fl1]|uniref:Uncharacterized protein n=1 Tax=Epichloe festucae (strain Fl1) TaxID=877507 RepID=A0A7S9KNI2_EPIFF|nr:hypothetical protein C2857_001371 [Epichloe festucae Fl1]